MYKQHFSAGRADLQFSVGGADVQFSASRADVQFSAGRADLQLSAGRAELLPVEISSILLWKFPLVTSVRHGLNLYAITVKLYCCLVAFLMLNRRYHAQVF